MSYVAPEHGASSFTCPYCTVVSRHQWPGLQYVNAPKGIKARFDDLEASLCDHCGGYVLWQSRKLVWPKVHLAPQANPDMPVAVSGIYNEARAIVNESPRGAAALLRLALQVLMKELGEPGKDLNKDIGNLVKKGLLPQVQRALDAVRVIGNEAVHPGVIDLSDDRATVNTLFRLMNAIVDQMITRHKEAEAIYGLLPKDKREGIERRDG